MKLISKFACTFISCIHMNNLCNEDPWQLMCIYQYPNSRILGVKKSTSTLSTHEWKDLYKKLSNIYYIYYYNIIIFI